MRILFFGDSITQGFWDSQGGWVQRLRAHYDKLTIPHLETRPGADILEFFNVGISGDTTKTLLKRIKAETAARIWPDDSFIICIAIGTNDDLFEKNEQWATPAEFEKNLLQLVIFAKSSADKVILIGSPACDEKRTTPVAWGEFYYTNAELERSEQAMKLLAKEQNVDFVPMHAGFKERIDAGENLLADGLHPNDAGHEYIAAQVLPVLDTVIQILRTV